MTTTDLRAQVARIQPGDTAKVRVVEDGHEHEATLTGEAWADGHCLCVGPVVIRNHSGDPGAYIAAVLDHQPGLPTEPPLWSVVADREGDLWVRYEDGWDCDAGSLTRGWANLNRLWGPLTLRARGIEEDGDE